MDTPFEYYFKFNRILLTFVGLWPYRQSTLIQVQRALFLVIFASGFLFQVTALFSREYSFDLVLKVSTYAILPVVYCIKYSCFIIASEDIKGLIDHARADWDAMLCKKEREIIREYAGTSRMLMFILALCFYMSLVAFAALEFIPQILDIVAPLNASRPKQLPMSVEYFVDQQRYFYLLAVHINFYAMLGITTVLATETLLVFFVQHGCGMFKICGFRAENAIGDSPPNSSATGDLELRHRIIHAVRSHKRVITFYARIQSSIMSHYGPLLVVGTIGLSVNVFRASAAAADSDTFQERMAVPLVIVCNFCYIFYYCYCGQLIIDHSSDMFNDVCNSKWYNAPVPLQKDILLFIQKSMKTSTLLVGGVYVPCFEGFTTLVNMVLSYVMLLHSVL